MTIYPDQTVTARAQQLTSWVLEDLKDHQREHPGLILLHTTTETTARLLESALQSSLVVRKARKEAARREAIRLGLDDLNRRIQEMEEELDMYGCGGDDYERLQDLRAVARELR